MHTATEGGPKMAAGQQSTRDDIEHHAERILGVKNTTTIVQTRTL